MGTSLAWPELGYNGWHDVSVWGAIERTLEPKRDCARGVFRATETFRSWKVWAMQIVRDLERVYVRLLYSQRLTKAWELEKLENTYAAFFRNKLLEYSMNDLGLGCTRSIPISNRLC